MADPVDRIKELAEEEAKLVNQGSFTQGDAERQQEINQKISELEQQVEQDPNRYVNVDAVERQARQRFERDSPGNVETRTSITEEDEDKNRVDEKQEEAEAEEARRQAERNRDFVESQPEDSNVVIDGEEVSRDEALNQLTNQVRQARSLETRAENRFDRQTMIAERNQEIREQYRQQTLQTGMNDLSQTGTSSIRNTLRPANILNNNELPRTQGEVQQVQNTRGPAQEILTPGTESALSAQEELAQRRNTLDAEISSLQGLESDSQVIIDDQEMTAEQAVQLLEERREEVVESEERLANEFREYASGTGRDEAPDVIENQEGVLADVQQSGLELMDTGQEFGEGFEEKLPEPVGQGLQAAGEATGIQALETAGEFEQDLTESFQRGVGTAGTQATGFFLTGGAGLARLGGEAVEGEAGEAGAKLVEGTAAFGAATGQEFTSSPGQFVFSEAGEEVSEAAIGAAVAGPAGATIGALPDVTPEVTPDTRTGSAIRQGRDAAREARAFLQGDLGFRSEEPNIQIADPEAVDVEGEARPFLQSEFRDTDEGRIQLVQGLNPETGNLVRGTRIEKPVSRRQFLRERLGLEEGSVGGFLDANALGIGPGGFLPEPEVEAETSPDTRIDSVNRIEEDPNSVFQDTGIGENLDPVSFDSPNRPTALEREGEVDEQGRSEQVFNEDVLEELFTNVDTPVRQGFRQEPVSVVDNALETDPRVFETSVLDNQVTSETGFEPGRPDSRSEGFDQFADFSFDDFSEGEEEFGSVDEGRFASSITAQLFDIEADEDFDEEEFTGTGVDIRPII